MPCLLAINRQSQSERTLKRPLVFSSRLQPASALRPAIDGWADEASAQHTNPCQPRGAGVRGGLSNLATSYRPEPHPLPSYRYGFFALKGRRHTAWGFIPRKRMSRTIRPEGAEGVPSTAPSGREIGHSPHPEDESSGSIPLPFQGTNPKPIPVSPLPLPGGKFGGFAAEKPPPDHQAATGLS